MPSLLSRISLVLLALAGLRLWAADDLPQRTPGEVPDPEPKLMLDDLPDLSRLDTAAEFSNAMPVVNVERAKAELDRARSKQQRWQKLAKAGVLSQVEAESTAIQVARALVKYQTALAAQAKAQVEQLQARQAKGESSADELAAAEAAERSSSALAADAAVQLQRQQRTCAEANLDRQRRLFALGVSSRSQLQRAQAAVGKLSPNPAPQ